MSLLTTAIVLLVLLVASAKTHEPIFLIGSVFVGLWAVLMCFSRFVRWVVGWVDPVPQGQQLTAKRVRTCPDSHCGRMNVWEARFCGQCGRRLV